MQKLYVPYTIVDCGFWHNVSFPSLPSGRVDYASPAGRYTIWGDGDQKTIVTDGGDLGKLVSKIIVDERTLNKYVVCCGDVVSQNDMFNIMEKASGEKVNRKYVSPLTQSLTCMRRRLTVKYPGLGERISRHAGEI